MSSSSTSAAQVPRWRAFTLSTRAAAGHADGLADDLDQPRGEVFTSRHLLPGFRYLLVPLLFLIVPVALLRNSMLLRGVPGNLGNALRAGHGQRTTPTPR